MGGRGTVLYPVRPGSKKYMERPGKAREIDPSQFKNLPTAEEIIKPRGYETLVAFNEDGVAVKAYKGGKHSVAFPVSEAMKWKNYTVTHNHPSSFGGTFSDADVNNLADFGYASHRATAKEGVYVLKPTANARSREFKSAYSKEVSKFQSTELGRTRSLRAKLRKQGASDATIERVMRQSEVGRLHRWMKKNASKYGYTYVFGKGK